MNYYLDQQALLGRSHRELAGLMTRDDLMEGYAAEGALHHGAVFDASCCFLMLTLRCLRFLKSAYFVPAGKVRKQLDTARVAPGP